MKIRLLIGAPLRGACWLMSLVLLMVAARMGFCEILPAERRIVWQPGVQGGIPNRTNIFCNVRVNIPGSGRVAYGDGLHDDSQALMDAINLCPNNQVVYIPTGKYKLLNKLQTTTKTAFTIRGDGPGKTIILASLANDDTVFYFGTSAYQPASTATILSGYSQGSTNIVLSSVSGISIGSLIWLDQLNGGIVSGFGAGSGSLPNGQSGGYSDRLRNDTRNLLQIVKATAISGNSVTFSPPLSWTYSEALNPQATPMLNSAVQVGVEDLTVTNVTGHAQYHFFFDSARDCWLKNIESARSPHWHVMMYQCLNCEIRDSYFHEATAYTVDSGYGIEARMSTGLLVENNIVDHLYASIMIAACNSCVYGYNYIHQTFNTDPTYMIMGINGNHGPHTYMNLFEGNVANEFQNDYFYGSSSHQTLFRNYFTGTDIDVLSNRKAVALDSHSFSNNLVGNVLGSPGLTWIVESTNANFSQNAIFRLGFPFLGNNSYTATIPPEFDTNVFALDTRVKATLLSHGNYDYASHTVKWDPTISDQILPASCYLSGKPSWFGDRPWPPFDPNNSGSALVTNIPAAYRFFFGRNPPATVKNQAPVAIMNVSPGQGLVPFTVAFSSAGSYDPEGVALTYAWTFGDGATATVPNPIHTYQVSGMHTARLSVSDGINASTRSVTVNAQ